VTHICLNIIASSYVVVFRDVQMTHWLNNRNFNQNMDAFATTLYSRFKFNNPFLTGQ